MGIKVSIIVPVYNTEKSVGRCIETLVNQTLEELEIILINDCSTDQSLVVLEKYKENYPDKIRIINLKENMGPGGARNEGINAAKGEYLGFVDSDDDVELNMFEELYQIACETESDMVDCEFFHEAFNINMKTTHESALGELNLEKKRELFIHSGFIWSKLIKRSIIIDNKIKFREKVAYEDIDFVRIVIFYCNRVAASNMILYNYRDNENSVTNNCSKSVQVYEKMDAVKFLVDKFKSLNVYDDFKEEIIYFIYKTYVVIVNYAITLKKEDVDLKLFKDMQEFFFHLVDYDYQDNKYIVEISEEDRLPAEINNMDYEHLYTVFFDS